MLADYLKSLTDKQLVRLAHNVWYRMVRHDGYQPFGYDWVTLWATRPAWMEIYAACIREKRDRNNRNKEEFELAQIEAEILGPAILTSEI